MFQRLIKLLQPTDDWGPMRKEHRLQYKYAKHNQDLATELMAMKENDV